MRKIFFIIILISIIISSCCENEALKPPEMPVTELWPLKDGNFWNYSSLFDDEPGKTYYTFYKVLRDTILYQNEPWKMVVFDSGIPISFMILKAKSDGIWAHKLQPPMIKDTAHLLYKYPAVVNESYQTPNGFVITVLSVNKKVSVPAGTFVCYHYKRAKPSDINEYHTFIAPGVGMVKSQSYFDSAGTGKVHLNNSLELIEYSLK